MIFVTLGTQDKSFTRLLKMVDECIASGLIKEEVIVQAGCTKYTSNNMKIYDFISPTDMFKYIKESKYIITHGGVGSILSSLNLNKKVIAVARLSKYKEHSNDHQLEIIKEFTKLGYILDGTNNLAQAILKLNNFTPKKYQSNQTSFVKLITDYIDNVK
jgi:UDP-N-acetylglucosamine transferase subunit ALG13